MRYFSIIIWKQVSVLIELYGKLFIYKKNIMPKTGSSSCRYS